MSFRFQQESAKDKGSFRVASFSVCHPCLNCASYLLFNLGARKNVLKGLRSSFAVQSFFKMKGRYKWPLLSD